MKHPDGHRVPGALQVAAAVEEQGGPQQEQAHSSPDGKPGHICPLNLEGRDKILVRKPLQKSVVVFNLHKAQAGHGTGGQQIGDRFRQNHAVEHGNINGVQSRVDQVGPTVQQRIDCQHGRPVSGEEYAKHRDAEEGEKLQIRRKEPPQGDRPGIYNAAGVQQRNAGKSHEAGGSQGKGQARKNIRHKDGLPPHRHGVQA